MDNIAEELVRECEESFNYGKKTPLYYINKAVKLAVVGASTHDPDINYLKFEDGLILKIDSREEGFPKVTVEESVHEI